MKMRKEEISFALGDEMKSLTSVESPVRGR